MYWELGLMLLQTFSLVACSENKLKIKEEYLSYYMLTPRREVFAIRWCELVYLYAVTVHATSNIYNHLFSNLSFDSLFLVCK